MEKLIDLRVRDKVFIAAHRGSSGTMPENTIAAFELAIADGVDMIETDIQSTADGIIITYHDLYFDNGEDIINIQETNYSNLPYIKYGNVGINPMQPPLIKDVFKIIKNKVYMIIEIKEINNRDFREVINELINIAKVSDVAGQILLSSFYPEYISYAKSIASDIPTAAIKVPFKDKMPSELSKLTNCEAFICSVDELNDKLMMDAKKHNIFIGVYSVDDKETLNLALKYKVNAVATNFPKKIVELLRNI